MPSCGEVDLESEVRTPRFVQRSDKRRKRDTVEADRRRQRRMEAERRRELCKDAS